MRHISEFEIFDSEVPFDYNSQKWDLYLIDSKGNCLSVGVLDDLSDMRLTSKLTGGLNKIFEQQFYENYE